MNEERIRRLRNWRITSIVIAAVEAGLTVAHALTASWPGTLILGIITLTWAAVFVRNTWKIRAATTVQARPASQVDWTMIRIMEHEVYDRIFQHDGAPGLSGTAAETLARQDDTAQIRKTPSQHPGTTVPATAAQYAAWLRGYVRKGGTITHGYDYPFARAGFRYAASGTVLVDSRREFGAFSRSIIAARGVTVKRTIPGYHLFGGWGHTDVFFTSGYCTNDCIVPVYSDPEFDDLRHLAKNRY